MGRPTLKHLWHIYYSSGAFHVFLLSILELIVLPSFLPDDTVQDIFALTICLTMILFMQRAPHIMADVTIPKWYTIIVDLYVGLLGLFYISGLHSYWKFSVEIYPIAATPITILAMIVVMLDEDFDIEEWDSETRP